MRFFTARRLALAAFLPALLSFTFIPGCSQQGEGERCGDSVGYNDTDDCASGLTCTQIDRAAKIYRCCRPGVVTDSRCIPVTSSGGDTAGTSGTAGTAGTAGSSSAGTGGSSGDSASAGEAPVETGAGTGGESN